MGASLLATRNINQAKVNWCWTLTFKPPHFLAPWDMPVLSSALLSCTDRLCPGKESALFRHAKGQQVTLRYGYQVLVGKMARNDHVQTGLPATQTLINQESCLANHLRNHQTWAGTVQKPWVTKPFYSTTLIKKQPLETPYQPFGFTTKKSISWVLSAFCL